MQWFSGAELQRCRDAEMQESSGAVVQWCRGGADAVQRRCRGGADKVVQWCSGPEEVVQRWCSGADEEVQRRCRGRQRRYRVGAVKVHWSRCRVWCRGVEDVQRMCRGGAEEV